MKYADWWHPAFQFGFGVFILIDSSYAFARHYEQHQYFMAAWRFGGVLMGVLAIWLGSRNFRRAWRAKKA